MDLSVIIPVYNEEANVPFLYRRLKEVLSGTAYSWELIFVDDGSTDGSLRVLREIKEESDNPLRLRIVQLSRNFGQHPALIAGFSAARGKVLITIDADLQIDPEYIVEIMHKMTSGFDFVSGVRLRREGSLLLRRFPSRILNLLLRSVTGKKLRDYNCPFNAMGSHIALAMREYGEMQRFYKVLAVRLATRIGEVEVLHGERRRGRSKYGILNLVDLFFDFVTNFSKQLFQRLAIVACGLCGISVLGGMVFLALRVLLGFTPDALIRMQALLLIGFTFGMQLLVLGVLGDFIIRIYSKIEPGPLYRIKKIW